MLLSSHVSISIQIERLTLILSDKCLLIALFDQVSAQTWRKERGRFLKELSKVLHVLTYISSRWSATFPPLILAPRHSVSVYIFRLSIARSSADAIRAAGAAAES